MYAIIALVTAVLIGWKRPLIASFLGCALNVGYYVATNRFEINHFISQIWLGCLLCFVLSFIFYFICLGLRGGKHNTGPSYTAGAGGGRGGAPPGGIVLSDEEIQRNKRK